MGIGYPKEIRTKIIGYNAFTALCVMMISITLGHLSQRNIARTAVQEWTVKTMTDEQKEKCRLIVEHYGVEGQRDILIEECAELIQAVCKIKRDGGGVSFNFLEELADVSIMIEQMKQAFTGDELIDYLSFVNRKIERQMCRMSGKQATRNFK